jgi:hypothetical protein
MDDGVEQTARRILSHLAAKERQQWLQRARFLFAWAVVTLGTVTCARAVTDRAALSAGTTASVVYVALLFGATVVGVVGLLKPTTSVYVFLAMATILSVGLPFASPDAQETIPGISELLLVLLYFGLSRILRQSLTFSLLGLGLLCLGLVIFSVLRSGTIWTADPGSSALLGVFFVVCLIICDATAAWRDQYDREAKLKDRLELRTAATASLRLLRAVLPPHVARQLLAQVPVHEMVESYPFATVAFINLGRDFYKGIVSSRRPAEIVYQVSDRRAVGGCCQSCSSQGCCSAHPCVAELPSSRARRLKSSSDL